MSAALKNVCLHASMTVSEVARWCAKHSACARIEWYETKGGAIVPVIIPVLENWVPAYDRNDRRLQRAQEP